MYTKVMEKQIKQNVLDNSFRIWHFKCWHKFSFKWSFFCVARASHLFNRSTSSLWSSHIKIFNNPLVDKLWHFFTLNLKLKSLQGKKNQFQLYWWFLLWYITVIIVSWGEKDLFVCLWVRRIGCCIYRAFDKYKSSWWLLKWSWLLRCKRRCGAQGVTFLLRSPDKHLKFMVRRLSRVRAAVWKHSKCFQTLQKIGLMFKTCLS